MAEENNTPDFFNQLSLLTQDETDKFDETKKQEYKDLIAKVIGYALEKQTLTDDEYSTILHAVAATQNLKSLFAETLNELDEGKTFAEMLRRINSERSEHKNESTKSKARGRQNQTKDIFNKLSSINRKGQPTNRDKKDVAHLFRQLTDEIASDRGNFNDKEITLLKGIYQKFKEEIDSIYSKIENPPANLARLYSEISGAAVTDTSVLKRELATTLTAILRDAPRRIQNETTHDPVPSFTSDQNVDTDTDIDTNTDTDQSSDSEVEPPLEPLSQPDSFDRDVDMETVSEMLGLKEDEDIWDHVYTEKNRRLKALSRQELTLLRQELDSFKGLSKNGVSLLPNVEDLLAANEVFKDDARYAGKLKDLTDDRLKNLRIEDITPQNATLYFFLCSQCANDDIKQQVLKLIATALENYDRERFGNKDHDELASNYSALTEMSKDYNPFDADENVETGRDGSLYETINLSKVEFTKNSGRPLSEEEQEKHREAVASLAKEMAIQRLIGKDLNQENLEREIKRATAEILAPSMSGTRNNGKAQINTRNLSASIANNYMEIETFKTRITQKFKKIAEDSPLVRAVTENVKRRDKHLTDVYGDKYIKAKRVLKVVGQTSYNAGKMAVMFTAAGLLPGGTAVLIGYNMAKTVKAARAQMKEGNLNKSQKAGVTISTITSLGLQSIGMASGLSAILPAEVLPNIAHAIVPTGRVAIGAFAATIPNWMESANIGLQRRKLKRKLKRTTDENEKQELNERLEQLKVRASDNKTELLLKTVGLTVGVTGSHFLTPTLGKLAHNAVQSLQITSAEQIAELAQQEQQQQQQQEGYKEADRQIDGNNYRGAEGQQLSPAEQNMAEATAKDSSGIQGLSAKDHAQSLIEGLHDQRYTDPSSMASQISEHVGGKSNLAVMACRMAPYALQDVLHLDVANGTPTTHNMLNALASSELTPDQQHALEKFINENFDDTRFKTENFPKDYGPTATSHASASHATSSSHATATSTATHSQPQPQPQPQTYTSTTNHTASAATAATAATATAAAATYQADAKYDLHHMDVPKTGIPVVDQLNEKYAVTNDMEGKDKISMKFEPVDKMPYQDQDQNHQNHQSHQERRVQVITAEQSHHSTGVEHDMDVSAADVAMFGSADAARYAISHGLVLDTRLTPALNHFPTVDFHGNVLHGGWACVCFDPDHPARRYIIPNDLTHDSVKCQSRDDTMRNMANHSDEYSFGRGGRHVYGAGVPIPDNGAIEKVHGILGAVEHGLGAIQHGIGVFEHAKDVITGRHH